ncbi:MAG: CAP domain-containing protein [Armatimonadota bacterium]|nr:CAP domain-containing protein [Armatimonadota bacterium]
MMRRHVFRVLSILGGIALGVWLSLPAEVTADRGDTWTALARRYGVAASALRSANPGMPSPRPGEAVRLPIPRWRFYLRAWGMEQAAARILVAPPPARRPAPAMEAPPFSVQAEDLQAVVEAINRERTAQRRPSLAWDDSLAALARARAEDMVARRYFSHNDPATGRLALEGKLSAGGEVLAMRLSVSARRTDWLAMWKASPPHWRLLTDPGMRRIGLGVSCGRRGPGEICIAVGVVAP